MLSKKSFFILFSLLIFDISPTFATLVPLTGVTKIDAGGSHTCAILNTGGIQCWGANEDSQLGNGTTTDSTTPVAVTGLSSDATAIAVGGFYTCAILSTNEVQCWGNGFLIPVIATGFSSNVAAIAAGISHTCAILTTGEAQCWGVNGFGQLGNGTTTDSNMPVAVTGLGGVTAMTAGATHTCAVSDSGVQCWGYNGSGQLGSGTMINSNIPVAVTGLDGVTTMAVGSNHTCAVPDTGEVQCWGNNVLGQLGNDTGTNSTTPVVVIGLNSVNTIVAGADHTCALLADEVQCWGLNHYGQLGNGTTEDSHTPTAVIGLSSGVAAIAAGESHTCVLLSTGRVQCWGYNGYGQLGNGTTIDSTTPVTVMVEAPTYPLTLNQSGTGTGTVSGAGNFAAGEVVNLTATPETGSTFDGWTPEPCAASFVMPSNALTCTATFTAATPANYYPLTLNQSGTGAGTVSGAGDFAAGVTVNLTATPETDSTFDGWTPEPCATSFVMPSNALTCTATFTATTTSTPLTCDETQYAVFDPQTGMMTIPAVDIPMLDPIMSMMTGTLAVFTGQLKIAEGIEDFQLVPESLTYLNDITQHDACHAEYTYAIDLFNNGGLLYLPFVEVPRVMLIPPDLQVPLGPTQIFEVTLRQLAIDPTVFHIVDYQFLQIK